MQILFHLLSYLDLRWIKMCKLTRFHEENKLIPISLSRAKNKEAMFEGNNGQFLYFYNTSNQEIINTTYVT